MQNFSWPKYRPLRLYLQVVQKVWVRERRNFKQNHSRLRFLRWVSPLFSEKGGLLRGGFG